MAKLVEVYREDKPEIYKRQLPLTVDEGLTMVMDLNSMGLICDSPLVRGRELDEFVRKCNILSPDELKAAFEVSNKDMMNILNQTVPCVGCRRSVERLFYQLMLSGHETLDPLVVTPEGVLTVAPGLSTQVLCTLLHGHSLRLKSLVDAQPRSKKSLRCALHSLDSQRLRPVNAAWCDVWDCMEESCREEVLLIDAATLSSTMENYLHKHRFCTECRTKVIKAYNLLIEEKTTKEKGYNPALYQDIRRCVPEKHIHLPTKTEYIADLIMRAEPELLGSPSSRRERHAKTLEIAQEEVLTCLGICVYERLHRIHLRLKEEECTCQVFAAIVVDALCRSFEMAVEKKQGISQLELLYEQITKEDLAKEQRKQNKKLKRRKKKERRNEQQTTCDQCKTEPDEVDTIEEEKPELLDICSCDKSKLANGNCHCAKCLLKQQQAIIKSAGRKTDRKTKSKTSGKNAINPILKKPNVEENADNIPCQSCQQVSDIDEAIPGDIEKPECLLQNGWSSSEHSQDCGYSSENNNGGCDTGSAVSSLISSPYGSEVACSDGFCNHERGDCNADCSHSETHDDEFKPPRNVGPGGLTLTLQQMLDSSDDDDSTSYIPMEDVLEFKSRVNIKEKREQLRKTLQKKFEQLCINKPCIRMRKCE